MTSPTSPPNRRRRRIIVTIAVLLLVTTVLWWYGPRGDARFVEKWRCGESVKGAGEESSVPRYRRGGKERSHVKFDSDETKKAPAMPGPECDWLWSQLISDRDSRRHD